MGQHRPRAALLAVAALVVAWPHLRGAPPGASAAAARCRSHGARAGRAGTRRAREAEAGRPVAEAPAAAPGTPARAAHARRAGTPRHGAPRTPDADAGPRTANTAAPRSGPAATARGARAAMAAPPRGAELAAPRNSPDREPPGAGAGRPGLLADVGELVVDPVARVARGDDPLQALHAAARARRRHRQRRVDRVGQLLDVERVDRQRELAELLVGAGVLRQDRDAVALVDERALLGDEVHAVEHRVDEQHVVVLVGGHRLLEVVAQLELDRHPVRRAVAVVDDRDERLDPLEVLGVLGHVGPRRHQLGDERDPLAELRVLLEEQVEGARSRAARSWTGPRGRRAGSGARAGARSSSRLELRASRSRARDRARSPRRRSAAGRRAPTPRGPSKLDDARARSRPRGPSGRGSTAGSCAGRSACGSR